MYRKVLTFWFEELTLKQCFAKDESVDQRIESRFSGVLEAASRAEYFNWREEPTGRLAEIIVLDQFSRNIHRDTPRAFSQDPLALALAQEAVSLGIDRELPPLQRSFLYMPYMHSESALIHEEALRLFNQVGLEDNYEFEVRHKAIIDRFGRYPHRNAILGRESTPEELAFLEQPGSRF
ncbi:DUF924 domain-containing protein [Enterovibrio sp. ZSDZ42]|uniref:DUF924 domain-containing protein n=1 Tax=Enterovibrio gelatinilyticus TaxID=2899819 RepID=A0ABT5R2L1_9GAMM|nr:DUF924 family protein [Enterovibrio sp. ZSDZ42]MDD1794509.1 DUF924 domain-containing protein [Enterovibrio sp. ZSDZ42]